MQPHICHRCGLDFPAEVALCPQDGGEPILLDPGDSHVGILLDRRYRLLERIGEGGVGAVYKALHIAMRKIVAIKILHREYTDHPDFSGRFRREAKAASRLDHPNIVTVTDFGVSDGTAFLVMEYLEGQSLTKLIDEGPLPIAQALALFDQILAALGHAHQNGVIHRDLKSANVFLLGNGETRNGGSTSAPIPHAKLLDFGFAKLTRTGAPVSSEVSLITQPGIVFGTPAYISPEQGTGCPVDLRTDIYAAGILLFEMLTGRRPFVGDTAAHMIAQHLYDEPPAPRSLRPELSPQLETVLLTAIAKKPENRFPSTDSFRRALARVPEAKASRALLTPTLTPPTPEEQTFEEALSARSKELSPLESQKLPPPKGSRWWVAVLFLLVGAAGGVLLVESFHEPKETQSTAPIKATARAEQLLAEGNVNEAEQELRRLEATDAYASFLLGNLYFSRSWWSEGLDAYERAIQKNPSFLQNQTLLENATQALRLKTKAQAEELLRSAKEAAYDPLIAATLGDNPEVRKAATALLLEAGQESRIDRVDLALRDLLDAETCEARREAVLALDSLKDPRAISALQLRYQTKPRPDPDACLRQDLANALRHLGVSLPEDTASSQVAPR